jgi:hypothetical protein
MDIVRGNCSAVPMNSRIQICATEVISWDVLSGSIICSTQAIFQPNQHSVDLVVVSCAFFRVPLSNQLQGAHGQLPTQATMSGGTTSFLLRSFQMFPSCLRIANLPTSSTNRFGQSSLISPSAFRSLIFVYNLGLIQKLVRTVRHVPLESVHQQWVH